MIVKHHDPAGRFIVNQADIAQRMSRGLGMDGSELPQAIDKQHNASIQVEDLTHPEFWWLRRGLRYGCGNDTAAVAGQFSFWELTLAATGAKRLVVVEQLIISTSAASTVSIGLGPAVAAAAPVVVSPTDDQDRKSVV